jgi:hypothetical protein
MIYSESAYFDGNHCQHVAAWEEHKRLKRIKRQACKAIERRRTGRAYRN